MDVSWNLSGISEKFSIVTTKNKPLDKLEVNKKRKVEKVMSAKLLTPAHLIIMASPVRPMAKTQVVLGLTGPCRTRVRASFVPIDPNGDALVPLRTGAPNFTSSGTYISP